MQDPKTLRNQATAYAMRMLYETEKDYAPDFASYVIEQALKGKRKRFEWMILDFRRQFFGDERTLRGQLKRKEMRWKGDDVKSLTIEAEPETDLTAYLSHTLTPEQRATFLLYYEWGLTCKEIGRLFARSEAWASLLVTEVTSGIER